MKRRFYEEIRNWKRPENQAVWTITEIAKNSKTDCTQRHEKPLESPCFQGFSVFKKPQWYRFDKGCLRTHYWLCSGWLAGLNKTGPVSFHTKSHCWWNSSAMAFCHFWENLTGIEVVWSSLCTNNTAKQVWYINSLKLKQINYRIGTDLSDYV